MNQRNKCSGGDRTLMSLGSQRENGNSRLKIKGNNTLSAFLLIAKKLYSELKVRCQHRAPHRV